jgi:hypothetical protein
VATALTYGVCYILSALSFLLDCYQATGKNNEALPLLQEAVQIMKKNYGDSHKETLFRKLTFCYLKVIMCQKVALGVVLRELQSLKRKLSFRM